MTLHVQGFAKSSNLHIDHEYSFVNHISEVIY